MVEKQQEWTRDDLYREVGQALSDFEEVEIHLSLLFSIAMGTAAPVGQAVWRSVMSFDTRMRMLTAACDASDPQLGLAKSDERDAAFKAARRAADLRAQFAHGVVSRPLVDGEFQAPLFYPSFALKLGDFEQFQERTVTLEGLKKRRAEMSQLIKTLRDYSTPVVQRSTA